MPFECFTLVLLLFRFHLFGVHHIQSCTNIYIYLHRIYPIYLSIVYFLHLSPDKKKDMLFCTNMFLAVFFQEWSHSTLDLQFVGSEKTAPSSDEAMDPMDMEPRSNANVPEEPGPELRFRLAQVTPVMGPTSGGVKIPGTAGG